MRHAAAIATLVILAVAPLRAQTPATPASTKKVLSIDDYARWRTIDNALLSADGKWAAYGLRFSNTATTDAKPVLHLRDLGTNQETEIADATQATFSPDSRWIVYQVDPAATGGRGGRGGRGGGGAPATPAAPPDTTGGRGAAGRTPAAPRRWEVRELATGKVQSWQDVQSAIFSPTSEQLLLRRRPAGGAATGAGAGAGGGQGGGAGGATASSSTAARGTDAILHDFTTGHSLFLGSVGEAAFNRNGELLAYTVDAPVHDGNGLFLVHLRTGFIEVLDNDSLRYSRLTWSDSGSALAVLKGHDVDKMRERDNKLLVVRDVNARQQVLLDPGTVAGFPKGFLLSDRASLAWSDDGREVFVGIIPQSALPDSARRRSADSVADVDVWRTQDERIQSVQMVQADADRNRVFRQGFDVTASKYITLTDSMMREVDLPATGHWAVGRDPRPYISDYRRAAADFFRVNLLTGERTPMFKGQLTGAHVTGISPDGKSYLYWKDTNWQSYDLDAGTSRTLASPPGVSFTDMEDDHPGPKGSYGVAGYATDGSGVIVNHRFDLWFLPLNGGAARNLTNGAGTRDKIVFRHIRTEPIDSSVRRAARVAREIDLTKPITFSTYGEYTKKAGFSRLADGTLKTLVFDDAAFSNPVRATSADKYLFTRQTFSEFPDLQVVGPEFTNGVKISNANPQQADFRWGHRVLFDFVTKHGDKLQGILALPDDYVVGEKRPMLVTFYEKNSQTMHRYTAPSFITGMGTMPIEATSRGYITMIPDVAYHTGSSHSDQLEAVEAATLKVIALGYADPKHIGLHGHSYGGEGAAFISTRSRLFAAVGVGAGVTDLFTDFSQSWGWSYQVATGGSGANGNEYYINGQGRWGFSPWEKPDVYHFESALTHVPEVTQPILIMHGTADPTVSFSEGMNFYNALRYNGKDATMLAYTGEGHGLRGLANRKDLTIRYFQFFDHFLKGAPAPKWMTDGVPFIIKETSKEPK
jgi:dipeptidyl aminopeptidase/acylaminoacyl peptidase